MLVDKMKPVRFYQIRFSHFCDKVRWSLDFYSIPYEAIDYSARGEAPGLEAAPPTLQKLVPIIEDPNNQSLFISDSTPIMLYLDERYGGEKSLFPANGNVKREIIVEYCLKLDSELGLYARRLANLYLISEKPAILSVLLDGDYEKASCDDWRSYFLGILGSCIMIARLGIHRIQEDHIFEKTEHILTEIKQNIDGKQYLFNGQFTAADLTLTALIKPLELVPSLCTKYESVFQYCEKIREWHDPKRPTELVVERLLKRQRKKRQPSKFQSTVRNIVWYIFYVLLYPLTLFFTTDTEQALRAQYPSINSNKKANNDVRILKFNSMINATGFFTKYLWHLCFTIPKQMKFVNDEGNRILDTHS
jgi:glutathione S-transferase